MSHRCGSFCPCGMYQQQHEVLSSHAATTSSVDCTLSLGTPSTRRENAVREKKRDGICFRSGFGWNITSSSASSSSRSATAQLASPDAAAGGDPLLARRCANCDTTSTPLWRNGPKGPKSLCNACGIRYKKEERRATAATAVETPQTVWGQEPQQRLGSNYDEDSSSGGGSSYLSWRFSIADRPGFVHDFGGF